MPVLRCITDWRSTAVLGCPTVSAASGGLACLITTAAAPCSLQLRGHHAALPDHCKQQRSRTYVPDCGNNLQERRRGCEWGAGWEGVGAGSAWQGQASTPPSAIRPPCLPSPLYPLPTNPPTHPPTHLLQIYLLSYSIMLGASSVFMSSFGYQVRALRATQAPTGAWSASSSSSAGYCNLRGTCAAAPSCVAARPAPHTQCHLTPADQLDGAGGGRPLQPRLPAVWHPHADRAGELASGLRGVSLSCNDLAGLLPECWSARLTLCPHVCICRRRYDGCTTHPTCLPTLPGCGLHRVADCPRQLALHLAGDRPRVPGRVQHPAACGVCGLVAAAQGGAGRQGRPVSHSMPLSPKALSMLQARACKCQRSPASLPQTLPFPTATTSTQKAQLNLAFPVRCSFQVHCSVSLNQRLSAFLCAFNTVATVLL